MKIEAPASENPTRYLLLWLDGRTSINARSVMPIRRAIEDEITLPRDEVEIDVWLESPGGDAHAAFKLALMLRAAAAKVRVVVPDYAKSAATLLALAGDEIYLAPGAELGPLDAQMPEEGSLAGQISALNIARAADDVAREAVDMAIQGGANVLELVGLSRAETIGAMLRFSAEFSEPLVRQLDPRVVHDAKQMLRVTANYAERLLSKTECSSPEQTATKMVENFPTHGFVIDIEEAENLGLPVKAMAEYDLAPITRHVHRASEDGKTCIEFIPLSDLMQGDDSVDDDTNKTDEHRGGEGIDQATSERTADRERTNGSEVTAAPTGAPGE
jgi:hypothetical protein